MTQSELRSRWASGWEAEQQKITAALERKRALALVALPKTKEGLTDIRGYSAPKEYMLYKTKKGIDQPYISATLRVKKQVFENMDLSYTDFEFCQFFNCRYTNCNFTSANLRLCSFWGCEFQRCTFHKTAFNESVFQPSGILFPEKKINVIDTVFSQCSFNQATFTKQGLYQTRFDHCNTSNVSMHSCRLQHIEFTGPVTKIRFTKCNDANVDLSKAILSDISLEDQNTTHFIFPAEYTC